MCVCLQGGRMPQECLGEKIISFPKDVFIKAQVCGEFLIVKEQSAKTNEN